MKQHDIARQERFRRTMRSARPCYGKTGCAWTYGSRMLRQAACPCHAVDGKRSSPIMNDSAYFTSRVVYSSLSLDSSSDLVRYSEVKEGSRPVTTFAKNGANSCTFAASIGADMSDKTNTANPPSSHGSSLKRCRTACTDWMRYSSAFNKGKSCVRRPWTPRRRFVSVARPQQFTREG